MEYNSRFERYGGRTEYESLNGGGPRYEVRTIYSRREGKTGGCC